MYKRQDYIYSTIRAKDDRAVIMIKVEDPEKAIEILKANDIRLVDTVDFGILRCIVPDPEAATKILKEAGFTASITEVVACLLYTSRCV